MEVFIRAQVCEIPPHVDANRDSTMLTIAPQIVLKIALG